MARLKTSQEAGFDFGGAKTTDEAGFEFQSTQPDQPAPLDPSQYSYEQHQQRTERGRQQASERENIIKEAIEAQGGKYSNDDFGDFWTETKITSLDKFDDKKRAFRREYPHGDLIQVPVEGEVHLYGRPNATSAYQKIGGLGESLTAAAPEVAGAVAGGLPRGAAKGILGAAVGAAAGKTAKEEYLRSKGLLTEGRGKTYSESFGLGVAEGSLEGVMRGLGFLGRMGKTVRESEVPMSPQMKRFIEEEDLASPSIGQVSEAPVIRQMFTQTSGTSAIPRRLTNEQSRRLLKSFNAKQSLEDLTKFSNEEIDRVLASSTRMLNNIVKKGIRDRAKAGKDIQLGLKAFKDSSREWVDRKYERAFAAAEAGGSRIKFDISNAQKAFRNVFEDVRGKTVTRGEGGRFQAGEVQINSFDDLDPKLKRQVSRLMQLNPTLSGYRGKNGFEQAKALRTNFYDLMHSDDPQTRRIATAIYGELTQSMRRPFNAGEDFVNKFTAASKANAWRERILEDGIVAEALTTKTPSDIAKRFFNSDHPEELKLIKRIVPKERFEGFKNHFKNDLLEEPNKISSKLGKFDQKTLDTVLTKEEQSAIRLYEKQAKLIDESMLNQIKETTLANHDKALKMVREADVDEVSQMVTNSGGKNSAFARSLREGIYYDILKNAHETVDGEELINPKRLKERIRWWRDQGKTKAVMDEKDWQRIENYEKYGSMVEHGTADVGGQIRAAQLAADVRKFWKPWAQFGAGITLASDAVTARLLSRHSDVMAKVPRTEKLDSPKLRAGARALLALSYDMEAPGDPASAEKRFRVGE